MICDLVFQVFLPSNLSKDEAFPPLQHLQHQAFPPPTSTLLTLKFTQSQLQNSSNNMATYTPSLALQGAFERMINPPMIFNKKNEPVTTKYEHHIATWACTKLKEVFSSEIWAITPEQKDQYTKKKPDLVVEKAIPGRPVTMKLHLCMELKKEGGNRMEDALAQLCESIEETIDEKGNTFKNQFEVFLVVQQGFFIGFFEFHMDQSNLDEEDIPHFRGCVSLTQDYKGVSPVMAQKPNDMEKLYFNYDK